MYFREVLVESLQSHLVLVFKSLVKLMVPVLTPCAHVIRPETLRTYVHALAFQENFSLKCSEKVMRQIILIMLVCNGSNSRRTLSNCLYS